MMRISEFANEIGVSIQTLRNWDKKGWLKPAKVTEKGSRYYTKQQLDEYLGKPVYEPEKITIGYCRVSSVKQKDDLERQIDNVKTFMYAKGFSFEIVTDIGSGINYKKPGFIKLIDLITSRKVDKLVVLYKDRLLRFGFEIIELLCDKFNVELIVIDNTEKSEQQELVEDLIQIVTVFSCRLQGKRSRKTKELIDDLKRGD
jgi:putative resolvase